MIKFEFTVLDIFDCSDFIASLQDEKLIVTDMADVVVIPSVTSMTVRLHIRNRKMPCFQKLNSAQSTSIERSVVDQMTGINSAIEILSESRILVSCNNNKIAVCLKLPAGFENQGIGNVSETTLLIPVAIMIIGPVLYEIIKKPVKLTAICND